MTDSIFKLEAITSTTSARAGIINTDHGIIETPFFMPVGTYGAVKTFSSEEIKLLPSNILLSNTYHLYLRPGTNILQSAGGLHKFMNWENAILTDSGGFQIFSLEGFRKISEEGVTFRSHLDGSEHHFTPETIIDIQRSIGSDFMMMLDVCPAGNADQKTWIDALEITTKWAKRGMQHYKNTKPLYGHQQILIPIIQGGTDKELRIQSANEICNLDANAYAIGGLAVGEPKPKMLKVVEIMNDILPSNKPRYLMGVGTPSDLIRNIARGIDMFDCVMPTRSGRTGLAFTWNGRINIKNNKYQNDNSPLDKKCKNFNLNKYSKNYLNHLFNTNEILGSMLLTLNNINFYQELMSEIRKNIQKGTFNEFHDEYIDKL